MSVKIVKQKEEFSDSIAKAVQGITLNQLAVRDNRIDTELSTKGIIIPAIAAGIGGTIVDWDIYDDADSPDGGAWRKKTSHTSWYNETLNTATRGSTRGFPARALVVAESAKVTIYDITKGKAEMWMVFNIGGIWPASSNLVPGSGVTSITMRGHILTVAMGSGNYGLLNANFASEIVSMHAITTVRAYAGRIVDRNNANGYPLSSLTSYIASFQARSVAITFLPNAPLDEYGMKIPTIAVAANSWSAGGTTVIRDDGLVSSKIEAGSLSHYAEFLSDGSLAVAYESKDWFSGLRIYIYSDPANLATSPVSFYGYVSTYPNITMGIPNYIVANGETISSFIAVKDALVAGFNLPTVKGICVLKENPASPANGMVAYITSLASTGYMVGDSRRAISYNSNSVLADRSVKASVGVVEVGTLTKTTHVGGRTSISGFSATNYIQEPSHADWNAIGTGDFSFTMTGVKWGTAGTIFGISPGFRLYLYAGGQLTFELWAPYVTVSLGTHTDTSEHVVTVSRTGSLIDVYIDGELSGSLTTSLPTSLAGDLLIGIWGGATPWVGGSFETFNFSATATSPEQAKFIAVQEKAIQGGKPCLLSNSASVSDLRYDKATDLYAVENGTNVDVFSGLQRVASKLKTSQTFDNDTPITTISGNVLVAPAVDVTDKKVKETQPNTTAMFSGDGALLSFALLPGRKPISVWVGGSKQIKGTTGDYTVAFDGFIYSVVFAVAPAIATNNIQVEGAAT